VSINKMILTAGPSITEKEISYVTDAVTNGWNENWSGYLNEFESEIERYISVEHAMATSSCTGALHLGLLALGIGPGDEVIVPEITWVATASAVTYVGAKPVFCDIKEGAWCLDLNSAESLITSKTKAIFPVHLYGHPADMPAVMSLAEKYDLYVIEDAAPSIGAEVADKKTGSFGDVAGFSFQGAKILSTGEGGMFLTNNERLFERVKFLGDHGRDPSKPLAAIEVGYKYKMSNLQAALGLAQLERVDELVDRKREINKQYRDNLIGKASIKVSNEEPGCKSNHWMTSVEIDGLDYVGRDYVMSELKKRLVDSRPVFSPMSMLPMFDKSGDNPVAYRIGQSAINLPSGHNLTSEEIDYVSEVLLEVVRKC